MLKLWLLIFVNGSFINHGGGGLTTREGMKKSRLLYVDRTFTQQQSPPHLMTTINLMFMAEDLFLSPSAAKYPNLIISWSRFRTQRIVNICLLS